jgi:palmitoyl-protein thioesterase
MLSDYLILCLGWATICLALPAAQYRLNSFSSSTPRPLVIWHGLGDTSLSSGMAGIKADIEEMYPGIFVKNLQIPAGGNLDDERKAGFVRFD